MKQVDGNVKGKSLKLKQMTAILQLYAQNRGDAAFVTTIRLQKSFSSILKSSFTRKESLIDGVWIETCLICQWLSQILVIDLTSAML